MLTEKPWRPDAVLILGLSLCLSVLMGLLLAGAIKGPAPAEGEEGSFLPFVVTTLSFHGMILVFTQLFLRRHGVGWTEAFGFQAPRQNRAVLLAVGATVLAVPITAVLAQICATVLVWLHVEPVAQQAVTTVQNTSGSARRLYLAMMAIGLAPLAEEILFRGILYPMASRLWNPRAAMWGTSLFFGAFHLNMMTFVPLTLLGVMLVWLYEKTGNLMSPILAHSLFNLANFFLLLLPAADGG